MVRKILVVDDERLVLDVAAAKLEDLGYEVEISTRPQDALKRIASTQDIDVLIAA
jgi:CheY-like chemotaxis protein